MLTGKELGAAIESARLLKKVSKAKLAAHFGVTPPSIQDWVKRGTIDKSKLPKLWAFFADVAPPAHWGLSSFASEPAAEAQAAPVVSVSDALASLGHALAQELPAEVREDIAYLMGRLAERRGATTLQSELARLLDAYTGEKSHSEASQKLDVAQPMSHPAPDDQRSPQVLGGVNREGSGWINNDRRTDPQRTNRSPLDRRQGEAETGTEGTDQ